MNYRINDEIYERIVAKFENGTFTKGNSCKLTKYYFERQTIRDFPITKRTPEVCSSLMAYSRCKLFDVPESSRTREFFIATFTDIDVFNYIKNNIETFDRQFFKDLLSTNRYATYFDRNCFEIMPLEYIDEEMCSLAILNSTDWSCDAWFQSVYKRKPKALTADLWKLGARLYARMSGSNNRFLDITPEEYKDEEYYKEMCSCNFNCGMSLDTNKGKIMDSIPKEVLTPKFLLELLAININNIARFNESSLETEISTVEDGKNIKKKIWQFVVKYNGKTIKYISLNDERIEYFLNHYDKDSIEYEYYFKDNYKSYMKEKTKPKEVDNVRRRTQINTEETINRVLFSAFAYSLSGEDSTKAIKDEINRTEKLNPSLLPIKYQGRIPDEYRKVYDSEEYLEKLYKEIGIQIIEEYNYLFYRVNLPEGWSVENDGYWNNVKNQNGNIVIEYCYNSKFYDRDAYVVKINIPKEKLSDIKSKRLINNKNNQGVGELKSNIKSFI